MAHALLSDVRRAYRLHLIDERLDGMGLFQLDGTPHTRLVCAMTATVEVPDSYFSDKRERAPCFPINPAHH